MKNLKLIVPEHFAALPTANMWQRLGSCPHYQVLKQKALWGVRESAWKKNLTSRKFRSRTPL